MGELTNLKCVIDGEAVAITSANVSGILEASLAAVEAGRMTVVQAKAIRAEAQELVTLPSGDLFTLDDVGDGTLIARPGEKLTAFLRRGHELGLI